MLSNELDITCYTPCVVIVKDLENIKINIRRMKCVLI